MSNTKSPLAAVIYSRFSGLTPDFLNKKLKAVSHKGSRPVETPTKTILSYSLHNLPDQVPYNSIQTSFFYNIHTSIFVLGDTISQNSSIRRSDRIILSLGGRYEIHKNKHDHQIHLRRKCTRRI